MTAQSLQTFSAPLGRSILTITAVSLIFLIAVGTLQIFLGFQRVGSQRTILLCVGGYLLLLVCASLLLKVQGYNVTKDHLVVKWGAWTKKFPLASIMKVQVKPYALRGSIRLMANGGVWSYLGRFSSNELGRFSSYVSDPEKTVIISLADNTIVVSPQDPTGFVAALGSKSGGGL